MGEQNEADAIENSDGRCRDDPEGDEVEQGADSRFRRRSAPIPGIGEFTRYFGGFRIGGSGRASQCEPLSQLIEQPRCERSAGHLAVALFC
jgi:hypothetical protein